MTGHLQLTLSPKRTAALRVALKDRAATLQHWLKTRPLLPTEQHKREQWREELATNQSMLQFLNQIRG